jgi:hypothetical protein
MTTERRFPRRHEPGGRGERVHLKATPSPFVPLAAAAMAARSSHNHRRVRTSQHRGQLMRCGAYFDRTAYVGAALVVVGRTSTECEGLRRRMDDE